MVSLRPSREPRALEHLSRYIDLDGRIGRSPEMQHAGNTTLGSLRHLDEFANSWNYRELDLVNCVLRIVVGDHSANNRRS